MKKISKESYIRREQSSYQINYVVEYKVEDPNTQGFENRALKRKLRGKLVFLIKSETRR